MELYYPQKWLVKLSLFDLYILCSIQVGIFICFTEQCSLNSYRRLRNCFECLYFPLSFKSRMFVIKTSQPSIARVV
jgi:hypothetical protein